MLAGQVLPTGTGNSVMLSSVAGQVESLAVPVGASVRAGQELLRIQSGELAGLQRAFLEARAQEDLAGTRLTRDEALFHDGIIAEARLVESRTARQTAMATAQEQRRLLKIAGYEDADIERLKPDTLSSSVALRARASGRVLEVPVRIGQRIDAGAVLVRLGSTATWWLELRASASQIGDLGLGDAVKVGNCQGIGRVTAIGAQFDGASQTLPVRAEFTDTGACLRANQYIQATVQPASLPADWVAVPASALVRSGEKTYVFVEQRVGTYQPVAVEVGRRQGARAWVSKGIAAGAKVVDAGTIIIKGAWLGLGAGENG
jgi:RND family efflux transporter MFP subunit